MPSLHTLAQGLLLPGVLCGLLLLVGERGGDRLRGALSGPAFGLVFLAAYAAWSGIPAWPGPDRILPARDWLAWTILAASVASLALPLETSRSAAVLFRLVFSAALAGFSLWARAEREGSFASPILVALAILALWILTDRWVLPAAGPRAPLALLLAATGTSLASLFAHSALIASLAGALAAGLGAALAVSLALPALRLRRGATGILVLVLSGCLVNVHFFAQLPLASTLLLASAILAPGLVPGALKAGTNRWRSALLGAVCALVPAVLGVWIAWSPDDSAY